MELTFANRTVAVDQSFVDTFPGIQVVNPMPANHTIIYYIDTIFVRKQAMDRGMSLTSAGLCKINAILAHWSVRAMDSDIFVEMVYCARGDIKFCSPPQVWEIWESLPELVDWTVVFVVKKPTEFMTSLLKSKQFKNESFDRVIEIKRFFFSMNYTHLFDENTPETAALIDKYNKDRIKNCDAYKVELPTDSTKTTELSGYREYSGEILPCAKMSRQPRCAVGSPTMVSLADATKRFHSYTNGLFLKSPNPEFSGQEFNWTGICVAGGSALKLITPWTTNSELRSSDIDVFVAGETFHDRSTAFKRALSWFEGSNVYFSVRGSVVTIFYKNMPRKIQLISISERTPFDVISRFDFSHVAVAFVGNAWIWTPEAWRAICTQTTTLSNIKRWNPNRMYKSMVNGFDVAVNDKMHEIQMDFKEILEKSAEEVSQMVDDATVWYYPRDEPDMTPQEERKYHIACIKKDTNAHAVGITPEIVLKNILIGGSFDSDYAAMSFSNFNVSSVLVKAVIRKQAEMILTAAGGIVRLITCDCDVIEAVLTDDGFRCVLSPKDEKFTEFIDTIEGMVFKMYRQRGVQEKLLTDNKFTTEMHAGRIIKAAQNGLALARTQRGEAVDLGKITPGNVVQMMFNIKFILNGLCRVVLFPIRFIKITEYVPEQYEDVEPAKIDDHTIEAAPADAGEIAW